MKKLFAVILAFLLMTSVANANSMRILIDGISVVFNDDIGYPFAKDNRTLVPLRATMESYGAEVGWDGETNTAVVKSGNVTVRCTIGEKCIYKNGKCIENDAAAEVKDGRTYLPIRAVLEAFGANVNWQDGAIKVERGERNILIDKFENAPSTETSYLVAYNNALSLKNSGNYKRSIETILSFSSIFVNKGDVAANAELFGMLGECYLGLEEYENAKVCFEREAYYWDKTETSEEKRVLAEEKYRDCSGF